MKNFFYLLAVFVAGVIFGAGAEREDCFNKLKKVEVAEATYVVELPKQQPKPPAWSEAEIECLARTIYGESRNQPYHGQVAVGAVVVARSLSPRWPSDLCAVVSQKGQFGGYYTAKIREHRAWEVALKAAQHATEGFPTLPESYRTSYFFRNATDSSFDRFAKRKGKIADHFFYGLKT